MGATRPRAAGAFGQPSSESIHLAWHPVSFVFVPIVAEDHFGGHPSLLVQARADGSLRFEYCSGTGTWVRDLLADDVPRLLALALIAQARRAEQSR